MKFDDDGDIYEDNIEDMKINHAQCFFNCEGRPYFYDDNSIVLNGERRLFVNFN